MVARKFIVINALRGHAGFVRIQFCPLWRADFDAVFFVILRQFVVGGRDFEGRCGLPRCDSQGFGDWLGKVGVAAVAVFEGDGNGYWLVARFI